MMGGIRQTIARWASRVVGDHKALSGSSAIKGRTGSLTLWPQFYDGQPTHWMRQDLQSYAEEGFCVNALIYAAIMYKVRAQQAAPLRAYSGSFDQPERLPLTHPLAALLFRPNNYQAWTEFHGLQTVYLNLSGNAYTYLERASPDGPVERLLPLRPDWVYHIPTAGKELLGYVYCPKGTAPKDASPLLPGDIIHVRLPNPMDPLNGMGPGLSPMSPIAVSGDVDNMASRFLRGFFRSGAMPIGILRYPTPLDAGTMDEIRERWKDKYGGALNWLDVAVLSDGGEYQRVGLTFDEMGFADLDERNETRILGPLGVPPILIGTRSGLARSTFANAAEARQAFWLDTFQPEMLLHEGEYQYALSGEDGSFVAFDFSEVAALQQNIPPLVAAAKQLWSMGIPASVATRAVGLSLPRVPGDDIAYAPTNLVAVGRYQEQSGDAAGVDEGDAEGEGEDDVVGVSLPHLPEDESGVGISDSVEQLPVGDYQDHPDDTDDPAPPAGDKRIAIIGGNGDGHKAIPDPFRGGFARSPRGVMAKRRSSSPLLGTSVHSDSAGGNGG